LLEPLVQSNERLVERVAELERENGRQAAELDAARAQISTFTDCIAAPSVGTPPEPSTWRSWASEHGSAAVAGFIAVVALVLGLVGVLH